MSDDGRELYAQSVEFDHRKASSWVKDNVLVHLSLCSWARPFPGGKTELYSTDKAYHKKYGGQCIDQQRGLIHHCPWRSREQIKREVLAFMDVQAHGTPELIGWCCGYDFVVFCQLFGIMMDMPPSFPHYMHDIQPLLDERGMTDEMLPIPEQAHHALADAKYIKSIWEMLHWAPDQIAAYGQRLSGKSTKESA